MRGRHSCTFRHKQNASPTSSVDLPVIGGTYGIVLHAELVVATTKPPLRVVAEQQDHAAWIAYAAMSIARVSGKKNNPIRQHPPAITIGYQRPKNISPEMAFIANIVAGNSPPIQPVPI